MAESRLDVSHLTAAELKDISLANIEARKGVEAERLALMLKNKELIEKVPMENIEKMSTMLTALTGDMHGNCGWGC